MPRKKTHEEYARDVLKKHSGKIKFIGVYEGNLKKAKHKCTVCKHEWDVLCVNILKGIGCPKCACTNSGKKRRKTHEQYEKEICEIHGGKISVVGKYEVDRKKTKHKCNECFHEWDVQPNSILNGSGCPKCADDNANIEKRKTHKQYVTELKEKHSGKIDIIDKYISSQQKIKHKCNICNNEWDVIPNNLLKGQGCPVCENAIRHIKSRKTNDEYVKEVFEKHGDTIIVISNYGQNKHKVKHKCNTCNNEWEALPTNILKGSGCPKCNESRGEKLITIILESLNVSFDSQVSFAKLGFNKHPRLTCDFIVYGDNKPIFVIEYNGRQHYEPLEFFGGLEGYEKTKKRDNIKRKMLREKGIQVIDIPYTETKEQARSTIEYFINYFNIKKEQKPQTSTQLELKL
ncbi:zinc-ribbon domain-containing protein [Bacillus mycoides]|uniref:zinc-ribbon domain-containing protein n=1 Tax=Bacillus mycoides TaxID=1405 RepID=UPI002E2307FA|nr:zinc-ribbon domain-containing protein [Bacillus mycoides]